MEVTGLAFVGTRTRHVEQMRSFVQDVLGLVPRQDGGTTFFELPDGSSMAVTEPADLDPAERTVGFRVADAAAAARELAARGVPVDELADNGRQRYVHFRAPDGQLYELVEERDGPQAR